MSAEAVLGRILDDPGRHRIEVGIRDRLPEVILGVDESGAVSELPEPAMVPAAPVDVPRDVGLQTWYRTPERSRSGPRDQVEVTSHQSPGEDSPVVEIARLADRLDESIRRDGSVDSDLAARDAAIDVVCGSRKKKARMSRSEFSPMRGRDTAVLLLRGRIDALASVRAETVEFDPKDFVFLDLDVDTAQNDNRARVTRRIAERVRPSAFKPVR